MLCLQTPDQVANDREGLNRFRKKQGSQQQRFVGSVQGILSGVLWQGCEMHRDAAVLRFRSIERKILPNKKANTNASNKI